MPILPEFLMMLACPVCQGPVELARKAWLVCQGCQRKYPIRNGIPVMLPETGDQYVNTPIGELPAQLDKSTS